MVIPFYQAALDAFDGGGDVSNRECDTAERLLWLTGYLFHLRSSDNGICTKTERGKFGTRTRLKLAHKYPHIGTENPKHR